MTGQESALLAEAAASLPPLFEDANSAGEMLRRRFFTDRGYGCYSNFDLRPDVLPTPDVPVFNEPNFSWTTALLPLRSGHIRIAFYWDGDGVLVFTFPDGRRLFNTDCKKDHGWAWSDAYDTDLFMELPA